MVRPTLIVSSCRGPEETCNPYMKLVGNTGNNHGSSHPYSQFLQSSWQGGVGFCSACCFCLFLCFGLFCMSYLENAWGNVFFENAFFKLRFSTMCFPKTCFSFLGFSRFLGGGAGGGGGENTRIQLRRARARATLASLLPPPLIVGLAKLAMG